MQAADFTLPPREHIILDFTTCGSIKAFYQEMRTKMDWDQSYGENLDALWDILSGMPYRGDDFTILRPKTYDFNPPDCNELGDYVDLIISIFREAETEGYLSVEVSFSET